MTAFFLLYIGPSGGWVIGAVGIVLVLALAAYVVFKILRRTVKMAFRMAVFASILVIAILGSLALWWFGTGTTTNPQRPRSTQTR